MEKLKKHYEEIDSLVRHNSYRIYSAQINLLNSCYQKCVGCRKYEWPSTKLEFTEVMNIINELSEMNCQSLVLSGGEPMKYERVGDIIEYANNYNIKVGVLTSGMFPGNIDSNTEYNLNCSNYTQLDKVVKYSDYIAFSYDGATQETFKKCRGVDCIGMIQDNIYIVNTRKSRIASKVRLKINMTVSNINYKEMSDVLKIAQDLQVNECNFFPIHTWNELKINNINIEEMIEEIKKVMIQETKGKVKTNIQTFLSTINRNKPHLCIMPFIHLVIDSDGSVFSCCRLLDDNGDYENRNREAILGNVKTMNLNQILQNGNDIRKKLYYANEKVCWQCDRYNSINEQYFKWLTTDKEVIFL